jgi:hypothetical protein
MMGRLKTIGSHVRNINMTMTAKTIKYEITIYSEKERLGDIGKIEIKNGYVIVTFNTNDEPVAVAPIPLNHTVCFN